MSKTATITDRIPVTPVPDVAALWWPDPAPVAVQHASEESAARLIALLGRLFGDVKILHEIDDPGRRPGPDFAAVSSYFGTALRVLAQGPDALEGLTGPVVEYLARYDIDDADERRNWKRAADEFHRRLDQNEQTAFLRAVRDRLQDVGGNLHTYRARVRAFDTWLGRVESWLGAKGAK